MSDLAELALVEAAIASGVTGCYEWDDKEAERVRDDPSLLGLTPEYIRQRLPQFVVGGGKIQQVPESRALYSFTRAPGRYTFTASPPVPTRSCMAGCSRTCPRSWRRCPRSHRRPRRHGKPGSGGCKRQGGSGAYSRKPVRRRKPPSYGCAQGK